MNRMKKFLPWAVLLAFLLSASIPLSSQPSQRSIRMKAGDSILVHCEGSMLPVRPLPAHWEKGKKGELQLHSDWLLTCEWGLD